MVPGGSGAGLPRDGARTAPERGHDPANAMRVRAFNRAKPRIVADSGPDQQEPEEDRDESDETDLTVAQAGDPRHRSAPLRRHQERTQPFENQDQARGQRKRLSHRARPGAQGLPDRAAGAAPALPRKNRKKSAEGSRTSTSLRFLNDAR